MDTIRMAIAGIIGKFKAPLLAKKLGDLNPSTLYKWSEPSTENDKHGEIPLRRAIQLTLVTGDSRLISAIAEEAGGVFIPGRQLVEGKFKTERAALEVMKASTELIESYVTALEDGKIDECEYRKLANSAANVHLAAACIIESAREKAGL